jgi:hypothetical protein
MQTLTFLWYELKAARRQVKEELAEPKQSDKVELLAKAEAPSRGIGSVAEGKTNVAQLSALAPSPRGIAGSS